MEDALQAGMTFEFRYTVGEDKTVPHLFAEAAELQEMPAVFATGFMVGLFELACIRAVNPHIDWPRQQTVGIRIDVTHTAPTPPGLTVTVKGTLEKVEGKKLWFSLEAHDGVDSISKGTHERFIIDAEKFNAHVAGKAETGSSA